MNLTKLETYQFYVDPYQKVHKKDIIIVKFIILATEELQKLTTTMVLKKLQEATRYCKKILHTVALDNILAEDIEVHGYSGLIKQDETRTSKVSAICKAQKAQCLQKMPRTYK